MTKGLGCTAAFSAAYGLRQRMLHFLQNIEHYMLFEVLEPNWHVLTQKLRAAESLDALLAHHAEFLDASLRECSARRHTAAPSELPHTAPFWPRDSSSQMAYL